MMRFDFTISHVPGKELTIADALSHPPASSSSPADMELEQEATTYVNSVVENFPVTEQRLQEIRECQQADTTCQKIVEYCKSGWPEKGALPSDVKPFHTVSSLSSRWNTVFFSEVDVRIVIPPPLRRQLLCKLHSGHQGITKCRELASQLVWWPGLSKQLEEMVQNCQECIKAQRQRPQPLTPTALTHLPWQKVASHLFVWMQATYLVVVDYYSRYIEIARLDRTTSAEVVTHLKEIFCSTRDP